MSFDLKIASGDLSLTNGDVATVVGSAKLKQDILKICLTKVGSNPFNPWYGSLLSRTMIGSNLDQDIIETVGKTQLETAIGTLKSLQGLQSNIIQPVSPEEQIAGISDISISRNQVDPRLYEVTVRVLSRALQQVDATFRVDTL